MPQVSPQLCLNYAPTMRRQITELPRLFKKVFQFSKIFNEIEIIILFWGYS